MPAKGGHLDLGDEEIRDIAKQVIELAQNYVEVKPSKVVSGGGYFKPRFGPLVSTAIETAPVVAWPPAEDASDRLKDCICVKKSFWQRCEKWEAMSLRILDWKIYPI
jgi:hypothetical protein